MALLDFETAWAEQEDLDALLAEKEALVAEIYWPNDTRGFATIIKAYAGYPLDKPLYGMLPPDIYLTADEKVPPIEPGMKFPVIFTYPDYTDKPWRRSKMLTIPIASPFLYALAIMHMDGVLRRDVEREGTVFFLAPSDKRVDIEAPLDEIAERLSALPDSMQPVTLCIGWHDYEKGRHKPFEERGMRIVSAGRLGDKQSIFRLVHILSAFKYACGNDLNAYTFYATAVGVPFFILDTPLEVKAEEGFERPEPSEELAAELDRVRKMFAEPTMGVSEEKLQVADRFLRADALKAPDSLLADLLYAEKITKKRVPDLNENLRFKGIEVKTPPNGDSPDEEDEDAEGAEGEGEGAESEDT